LEANSGGLGLLRRHVIVVAVRFFLFFFVFFRSKGKGVFFNACGRGGGRLLGALG
jgi:hypothetical protein